ncbi:hypothetical protein [Agrobacterium sp. T29]|nr:hypothetical protein [Agrobacterium sp. T29]
MRYLLAAVIVIFSTIQSATAESGIGFKQIELPDEAGSRTLAVSL